MDKAKCDDDDDDDGYFQAIMPSKISYQTGKMNSISKAKENIILFLSIAG